MLSIFGFHAPTDVYQHQADLHPKKAVGKQKEMAGALFRAGMASGVRLERFRKALELTELNRDVLTAFIDRILVYEDKRIYVKLKMKEFSADP